jgi:hypothetical protein
MEMPITGWKVYGSILGDLQDDYDTKSELWNDIMKLLTLKYDVSHIIILDREFDLNRIEEQLQEIIDDRD